MLRQMTRIRRGTSGITLARMWGFMPMGQDQVSVYVICSCLCLLTVTPGVNFKLILTMDIAGLLSTQSTSTQVDAAPCPFELPINSV